MARTPYQHRSAWDTQAVRRILFNTDVLAHSTTLLLVVSSTSRLQEHLPTDVTNIHFGPRHPLFSYWACAALYIISTCALLLLLAFRSSSYFKHRTKICLAMRFMRLLFQTATLVTPSAAFNIASAVVSRVSKNPAKAPAMLVIHPMVFYAQSALMLLPWIHVAPIQLMSTISLLVYMWQFPCFLQHMQPDPSTYLWQGRAEASCSKLQSFTALVSTAVGGNLSEYSSTVCQGRSGLQALQIFCTILCLFIVPVTVTFEFEHWIHRRCNRPLTATPLDRSNASSSSSAASIHSGLRAEGQISSVGSSSSSNQQAFSGRSNGSSSSMLGGGRSSSNSSQGGGRPSTGASRPGASGAARHADVLWGLVEAGMGAQGTWGHVCLLLLVLALVLPVVWLLSEFLAEYFEAARSCPAIIAAATGS